ncbi:hypothetical protein AAHB51_27515 [Bacillus cereus]
MTEVRNTEMFYVNEIENILAKINISFQNEQQYNYDLLRLYNVIEYEFKQIKIGTTTQEQIVSMYEKVKSLLQ